MVKRNRKTGKKKSNRNTKRSRSTRRSQRGGDGEGQLKKYQEEGNTIYKAVYGNTSKPPPKKSWWEKSWAEIQREQNLKNYGPYQTGLSIAAEGVDPGPESNPNIPR